MGRFKKSSIAFVLFVWLLGLPTGIRAQATPVDDAVEPKSVTSPNDFTADSIQARLKKVDDSKTLSPSVRQSLMDTYQKILEKLKSRDQYAARAADFINAIKEIPAQQKTLNENRDSPADVLSVAESTLPLPQLRQTLTQAETQLAAAQKTLADVQVDVKRRTDRRLEIPKLLEAVRQELADIDQQRAVKPAADEFPEITEANRMLLDARQHSANRELEACNQELRYYEASSDLMTARRDLAVIQSTDTEKIVNKLREAVNERRRTDADAQARNASLDTLHSHPAIKQLAKESADLTLQRKAIVEKLEQVGRDSDSCDKTLNGLQAEFAKITDRMKRVGLTQAIGLMLRKQREELPDIDGRRSNIEKRQAEISSISLELVELEDQRTSLADLEAATDRLIDKLPQGADTVDPPLIRKDVSHLLQTKRDYLDSLIADSKSYLDKLVELDTRERQLIRQAQEYRNFCNEYILWTRSTEEFGLADMRQIIPTLQELLDPQQWKAVGVTLASDVAAAPQIYIACGVLLAVFLFYERRWKQALLQSGEAAVKSSATSFQPTLNALVLTVLISITWPALMWLVGIRLDRLGKSGDFVDAVGHSLQFVALLLLTFRFTKRVCSDYGLGPSHFGWNSAALKQLRHILQFLLVAGLPIAFLVVLMEAENGIVGKRSLGRAVFLIGQLLLVVTAHQAWWATQPMAAEKSAHDSWIWSVAFRRIWYWSTVSVPVVLAVLAVLGYYYSATQLEWRLIVTFWLILGVVIAQATMLRGLLVAYRDLAIRRAQERRVQEVNSANTPAGKEAAKRPDTPITLSDINEQMRTLVRLLVVVTIAVGLCLTWVEVLPALRVLRRVQLWPRFDFSESLATGNPTPGILTLADVVAAIATAVITYASAKNITGLLEMTILRQMKVDSGVRYAVTAISRYIILVTGVVVISGQLGIAWTHIQWLVAAVTVGLGFGLQEIFGNFVSGLILLFERPIRIGDVVTVGDVTGQVTRIRIRATIITDGDARDLIVPNKEFITAKFLNWTLTNTMARLTIKVSAPMVTDPDLVRRLLLEAALNNPSVLKSPPPQALLEDLGDGSLHFALHAFLSSLDATMPTRHQIQTTIRASFQEAGIFPTLTPSEPLSDYSSATPAELNRNGIAAHST